MNALLPDAEAVRFEGVTITYGGAPAVQGVSLTARPGEILGIVGESGSGKSTLVAAVLGGLRGEGRIAAGTVAVSGRPVNRLDRRALDRLRGEGVALVPQNPTAALAPHLRVGDQFADVLHAHGSRLDPSRRAAELFRRVGLPSPETIGRRYPHQLSGGQQQRVAIALALALSPRLVVLDEPTTGLDVTTQRQIVDLLRGLRGETGAAMLYVTHDLALLGTVADRVAVLYAGRLVEVGPTGAVLGMPIHPYTRGLIASVAHIEPVAAADPPLEGSLRRAELPPGCPFTPRCPHAMPRCRDETQALRPLAPEHGTACWRAPLAPAAPRATDAIARGEIEGRPVLSAETLTVRYHGASGRPALDAVSLGVAEGEVLAVVGESGSGKSTLAKAILGIAPVKSGRVVLDGNALAPDVRHRSRDTLRRLQLVFQNPDASLNPRQTVETLIARPARILGGLGWQEAAARAREALAAVNLDPAFLSRLPAELSGGERQRVAIARALVVRPDVMVCDEILSALDASVQAGILMLLDRLRRETGIAIVLITHDLAVVRTLADRVAVFYAGTLVEMAPTPALFGPPRHPYTDLLVRSAPRLHGDTGGEAIPPPGPIPLSGCAFAPRCPHRLTVCESLPPATVRPAEGHTLYCHRDLDTLSRSAP